jgi:hypothetical protein
VVRKDRPQIRGNSSKASESRGSAACGRGMSRKRRTAPYGAGAAVKANRERQAGSQSTLAIIIQAERALVWQSRVQLCAARGRLMGSRRW